MCISPRHYLHLDDNVGSEYKEGWKRAVIPEGCKTNIDYHQTYVYFQLRQELSYTGWEKAV